MIINEDIFFRQATLRICGNLDIEDALHSSLEYLAGFMPADLVCLQVYAPEFSSLRIISMVSRSGRHRADDIVEFDPRARKVMDRIRERFETAHWLDAVIVNDPDKDPAAKAVMENVFDADASLLHMVLETADRPLCSVILAAKGKNRYSEEDARFFSLLKEPFSIAVSNALKHREAVHLKELLADDNQFLHRQLLTLSGDRIIGADSGLKHVMRLVNQVAGLDSSVLLTGETGVGKEVIANAVHYSSARKKGPFIAVNCGAIPDTLLDSELFGHEKGAFTGAAAQKRGRFERADSGSVFLDEIGELPLHAQARLLRVLQHREIERIGGTGPIPLDIRVIAATNKDLETMVEKGQFREDLFFRLNVFPICIPPLRDRREDIAELTRYFIAKKSKALKLGHIPPVAAGAMGRLRAYDWPGNVRELENVVERELIVNRRGTLRFDGLFSPPAGETAETPYSSDEHPPGFHDMVSGYIRGILRLTRGKIHGPGGAAEIMGLNPSTLRSKMKKYGIDRKGDKP